MFVWLEEELYKLGALYVIRRVQAARIASVVLVGIVELFKQ
jgi:hypothetical protein